MNFTNGPSGHGAVRRLRGWFGLLLLLLAVCGLRLFYLQIIQYGHYHAAALDQQFKQYEIPADRGIIEAHDGDKIVPIVLNQKLYTLYADPKYIKNAHADAEFVAGIIGGKVSDYEELMKQPNRYDILAKKLPEDKMKKLMAAKKPGLNVETHTYRVYPDGNLAAQVLGFVNDDGKGTYGIEEVLNKQLAGRPGLLKAITDARGVPLPASSNNVQIAAQPGKDVALTLDMSIQRQVETILQQGLKKINSKSGSIIVMDPYSGAVVAMANYPTYDPADYEDVGDPSVFDNQAVASQVEVGSIMKVLTAAAALNQGTITPTTTYYDPGYDVEDGVKITNVLPLASPTVSIQEILRLSLNTGAIHMLKTMGGDDSVNQKARTVWYDYMVNHFGFGKPTGIEQSYEASGHVPDPNKGYALELKYADTAFGQGQSVTMLQMTAAVSAVLNGGTYYQPHLVDGYVDSNGNLHKQAPKVVRSNIVKPQVGKDVAALMKGVFDTNYYIYASHLHPGYTIGGKTGTAQIPVPGGYDPNLFNGTFIGYVGGDKPQYVVAIMTKAPKLPDYEYAGSEGAAPLFGAVADMLIDGGKVTPISH